MSSLAAVLIINSGLILQAKSQAEPPSDLERVAIFAIQQEVNGSDIKSEKDICIALGHGLPVRDKTILSNLAGKSPRPHPAAWCTTRNRGVYIYVLAPINESSPGQFEVAVEVGDAAIKEGSHFATLLRRGTYVIRYQKGFEPKLETYRQTCCPETK
jgi:hypothetical protein